MIKNSGQIVQAFPVQGNTRVVSGTFDVEDAVIVHCNEACTLTFTFSSGNTVVIEAAAGSDWAIGEGCQTIDATATVIVS